MFLLASASPRRKELLQMMGCEFRVRASSAEEAAPEDGLDPAELALRNAKAKALAVAREEPGIPVLGADTVVALGGAVYGKPRDAAEAAEMLRHLAGRAHEVVTGVALARNGEVFLGAERTEVEFGPMAEEEILAYVATGEPMDKAGAYAIQGRAEAYIKGIRGSWSNVVGLPLYLVRNLAGKAGVMLHGDHGQGSSGQ